MRVRERLIELLLSGEPVDRAFTLVRQEHGRSQMKIVVDFDGGINNLPDAACVARQLKDKPQRTRQDILDAFAACSKAK